MYFLISKQEIAGMCVTASQIEGPEARREARRCLKRTEEEE